MWRAIISDDNQYEFYQLCRKADKQQPFRELPDIWNDIKCGAEVVKDCSWFVQSE